MWNFDGGGVARQHRPESFKVLVLERDRKGPSPSVCLVKQRRGRISYGKLLRNPHLDKDTVKRIAETLVESGTFRKEFGDRGGVFYVLTE